MQEKPRFGIALAGVGGCLCIAAGIVVTAPRESAVPSVNGLPAARAERLPRLPMPSWSEVAVTRPTAGRLARCARRSGRARPCQSLRAHPPKSIHKLAIAARWTPANVNRQSSIVNPRRP